MELPRSREELAKYIDHTLLNPSASYSEIDKLCDEARLYGFYAVCVNPIHVARCRQRLQGTDVKVVSVVGFPFGASRTDVKTEEASRAIDDGADEIDFVMNIGALRSGDLLMVRRDMEQMASLVKDRGKLSKVILETGYLTDDQKAIACQLAVEAGIDFVKTSTGYGPKGATVEDVMLMKRAVGNRARVKAAGGITDAGKAMAMIGAGASRIGSSHGVQILLSFNPNVEKSGRTSLSTSALHSPI
ncbi:MAG TPA: deoxyribose-phosphate aldolase [Thermoprotei archaeon]|nr:deoxyribose-phosphate aldolase [TACK group archaeon]HEV51610.1 deoxyribose-phosphate aldolase [Thermoprotei archaeon]